jgi:hypothetical protein
MWGALNTQSFKALFVSSSLGIFWDLAEMQNSRPYLRIHTFTKCSDDCLTTEVLEAAPKIMDFGLKQPHHFIPLQCVCIIIICENIWRALIMIIRAGKSVKWCCWWPLLSTWFCCLCTISNCLFYNIRFAPFSWDCKIPKEQELFHLMTPMIFF